MDGKAIAIETLDIISNRRYYVGGSVVELGEDDFTRVVVISPSQAAESLRTTTCAEAIAAQFIVDNVDSFEAAAKYGCGRTLVLNFANAYHPGGGFLRGCAAQEEALCRCSTLYASLTSNAAKEMYDYNNAVQEPGGSDYILLSPDVVVFRDAQCNPLPIPFKTSVITAAAPNVYADAEGCSEQDIKAIFIRKIRNIAAVAAAHKYDTLILGAWGCGAFGNNAKLVAQCFYDVFVEQGLNELFNRIVFAVYSKYERYNLTQFELRFCRDCK